MKSGFLVIDKPAGITSHDVVAMVRAVTGVKKVGHTGTLDPFATGVLPLAIGGCTKLIEFLDEKVKVYDATIRLGASMDTGDLTGQVLEEAPVPELDSDRVRQVLERFIGEQLQTPPPYSAVKYKGKPLYYYARKGEKVEVPARPITIFDLDLLTLEGDELRFLLTCSRGTYARVLAEDIAMALGTKGHLVALERLKSGPFTLEHAVSIQDLAGLVSQEEGHTWEEVLRSRKPRAERVKWRPRQEVAEALVPHVTEPRDALGHLPALDLSRDEAKKIKQGRAPQEIARGVHPNGRYVICSEGRVVAIAEATLNGPKTVKVL